MTDHTHQIGRRQFLERTAATAVGLTIVNARAVRGTQANSAVRLGLIGAGGRGTAVASGFVTDAGARVTAIADLFADQLAAGRKHFDELQGKSGGAAIDAAQLFQGPDAYKRMMDSKAVDFVQISTPPYFHPEQLAAAIAAGKHVYCEKPVAIDVPGAKRVIELGKKAEGKVSLDVGFQIRKAPPMVELAKRIWGGALGKIASGDAYYFCGAIPRPAWPGASPDTVRVRNWLHYRVLSGDIVVEQNIHVLDMVNWFLQGRPEKVVAATCGRKARTDAGDCKDNFSAVLVYPNDVQITFGSTQFGDPEFDASVKLFGPSGSSESHYDHRVKITGANKWDAGLAGGGSSFSASGTFAGALDKADPEKQKAFVESITSGKFHNEAAQGAESALTAMLVRDAAYKGKSMTWDELLASTEVYDPKIDIAKLT
jgi:predicted dehydrogenase